MKFNEYPVLAELSDDDLITIWDDSSSSLKTVTLASLKTFFGTPSAPTLPVLTWVSNGDANGICYWLATKDGTAWSNPHTSDKLTVICSGIAAGSLANVVNRSGGVSNYSSNSSGSYWGINLKTHKLLLTDYTIQHDANSSYALRSWKLQGSNNGSDWTDLDTKTDNTTLYSPDSWIHVSVSGLTVAYQYFKVLMTAVNSAGSNEFCCGELEFYGQVVAL